MYHHTIFQFNDGSNRRFPPSVSQKRLDLKSLKRQTKAEELGTPCPDLLSLRLSLKALKFEPFLNKNSGKTTEPRVHRGGTDPLFRQHVPNSRAESVLGLAVAEGYYVYLCVRSARFTLPTGHETHHDG